MKRIVLILLTAITLSLASVSNVSAQCAMCSANAEQGVKNGNTQSKGLNAGVLYLLSIPFLLITGIGVLWYVKYREKSTDASFSH